MHCPASDALRQKSGTFDYSLGPCWVPGTRISRLERVRRDRISLFSPRKQSLNRPEMLARFGGLDDPAAFADGEYLVGLYLRESLNLLRGWPLDLNKVYCLRFS